MPVVGIAIYSDKKTKIRSKIKWLREDIYIYNDTIESEVECVIESKEKINEALILITGSMEAVEDATHLYEDRSFQTGYAKCWMDRYQEFGNLKKNKTIKINNITAKVCKTKPNIVFSSSKVTAISVLFDQPVKNETIVFRLSLNLSKFILKKRVNLPLSERQLTIHSYGLEPFAGSILDKILLERGLRKNSQ